MVNVEKRYLVILLTYNEEKRVEEFDELGEEVPPMGMHKPDGSWICITFIEILTQ